MHNNYELMVYASLDIFLSFRGIATDRAGFDGCETAGGAVAPVCGNSSIARVFGQR